MTILALNQSTISFASRVIVVGVFLLATFYFQFETPTGAQSLEAKRFSPELVVQGGHSGNIPTIAFSPDGKILATGSDDTTVKLWDVETEKELRTLYGHSDHVSEVAFSPDGKILASAGKDWLVRLWDVARGKQLKQLEGSLNVINSVAFSSDGTMLASGCDDETVRIWNVETGKELRVFGTAKQPIGEKGERLKHRGAIKSVAFGPLGDLVASGSADGIVSIWNLRDGTRRQMQTRYVSDIHSLAFTPDRKRLISAGLSEIAIWDADSGQRLSSLETHTAASDTYMSNILDISLSPDGNTVASINLGRELKLWDVGSGRPLKILVKPGPGSFSSIGFSRDGKTIATAGSGTRQWGQYAVRIWNLDDGRELRNFEAPWGELYETGISANRELLVTTHGTSDVSLWDLSGRRLFRSLKVPRGPEGVFTAVPSPDGSVVGLAFPSTFQLWDARTGKHIKTWDQASVGAEHLAAFTPDGKYLVTSQVSGLVVVSTHTGETIKSLSQFGQNTAGIPTALTLDRSGRTVAVGSYDGKIRLWDLESGNESKAFCDLGTAVSAIAFSDDGALLASTAMTANVKICDVRSGAELQTLRGRLPFLNALAIAFSPDSRSIATLGWDGISRIWDVAGGRELKSFVGETMKVEQSVAIAFSPDGKTLLTSGRKKMKLWNVETGQEQASLVTLGERDWAIVTPSGLFDASEDGQGSMHFIAADAELGYETISLDQLKSRYHVPGLLKKVIDREPLPRVGELSVTLFPDVRIDLAAPDSSSLNIALENRGGGIGRVEVRVNGSELIADARAGKQVDSKAVRTDLRVDVPRDRLRPGANKIEVIAWNLEGDVRSRSHEIGFDLKDSGLIARDSGFGKPHTSKKPSEINFYAIVSGIADYSGENLDLRYAAKDAEDISKAITIGARKYFCNEEITSKKPCERVRVRLLSTETNSSAQFTGFSDVPDFRRLDPVKTSYAQVFDEIAKKAKPEDVVLVYLSGHGTSITSEEAVRESAFPDMYLYATRDASTLDRTVMVNQTERESKTVSSLELAKWISGIKAEKKVMILDTCAAGSAQKDLAAQTKSADALQLRSIGRLRERTGFYILMGSAADKVSYEANEYRQGLLTFSLLEAMTVDKGLRDGKFVDIENWFGFAEDKVEGMAKGLGGIQRPSVFKSNFAKTFDIGRIESDEMKQIPLARRVPLILQPELREKGKFTDRDRLTEKLESRLVEQSLIAARGEPTAINYIKATAAAHGLSPRGVYTVTGDQITIEVSLIRDEEEVAKVTVSGKSEDVIEKLLRGIVSVLQGRK